ncbi:hypothetical protein JCM11251_006680 [Rhodosporidiobolus azoricus]
MADTEEVPAPISAPPALPPRREGDSAPSSPPLTNEEESAPTKKAAPPLPPPPPRRDPSLDKPQPEAAPATSWWQKAKGSTAGAWDAAYKQADKIGFWSNKQADKVGVESFYPTSLSLESVKCARILRTFTMDAADLPDELSQSLADRRKSQVVLRKIPPAAIAAAQGLAIFTVLRSGFVVSGASGSGVVLARLKDGRWSAPSGILMHTIGFGFAAGVDVYDVVLILRNDQAVESFKSARISLGGEVSIAAGPVGNGMQIETTHTLSPVWSYTKSKGLYGGVQLDGSVLIERNDENARSYGRKIKASEILEGETHMPEWVEPLHQTIAAAEGLDYRHDLIPLGPSVSEIALSPNPNNPLSDPTVSPPSTASPGSSSPPPSTSSPHVTFLSSFSRSTSQTSASLAPSSRSRASSSASSAPTAVRKLPKEDLDDEDLAARKELEAALRSFGIEDPDINAKSRAEDKLLVVEEKEEEGPGTGMGIEVPTSPVPAGRDGLLSDEVEHPPDSPSATGAAAGRGSTELARSGSLTGAGEKPPVPPRRTPRIGTGSVPGSGEGSPVVKQGEGEEGEGEEKKNEEEEKQDEEEGKGKDGDEETEAGESFEDASEGKEGEKEGQDEKKEGE